MARPEMPCTVHGMPRPRTKGDTISLRFPIDGDRYLRAKAAAAGKTPADYIVERFMESISKALSVASDATNDVMR